MKENRNFKKVQMNYFLNMSDPWNVTTDEPLERSKLWKKVTNVKPKVKLVDGDIDYEKKLREWNKWDDDNYLTRTIMSNTTSRAQILKESGEKIADKL